MRKTVLYIAASMDNFIAKTDGDIQWLHAPEYVVPGEDYGYGEFIKTIDTSVLGYKTYEITLGFNIPNPFSTSENYVLTKNKSRKNTNDVTFISDNIIEFMNSLKTREGKNIWLMGGGEINSFFLLNDLIDQIILTTIPVTLGDGIPLFAGKTKFTNWHLVECKSYKSGLSQLMFNRDF